MWGNVNYYKSAYHPIPTLPVRKGNIRQFKKQISKISFQLSVQVCSLLGKSEGEKKTFLGGCKKGAGGQIMRFHPRVLDCHKRWTISPFLKLEIILPLLCFLLDPLTDKQWRTWSSMINLWIDSRTCQK